MKSMDNTDSHANITNNISMDNLFRYETDRMQTFLHWPAHAPISATELAQAGFYYLSSGDKVKCAFCKGVLQNWAHGDSAIEKHQRHFPNCAFVQANVGNVARLPSPRLHIVEVGQHHELQQTLRQLIEEGDISDDTKEKLLEEVEKRECKVCLQNFSSILFLPCRHLSCCRSCATYMQTCPVCREIIRLAIPVHFGTGNLPVPVELINMSIP